MIGRIKVLAVDDEDLNLDIMNEYFEEANFDSLNARNGHEALDALEKNDNISVIVLDRMMPHMDGMEFLKRLRQEKKYKDIPVVMQTAASASHQITEGLRAGVFYYLSKPYTKDVFLAAIKNANDDSLKKNQLRGEIKELAQGMTSLKNGEFTLQTISEAKALAMLVGASLPQPDIMTVGLTELLVNAVEHGNLGITYKEKGDLKVSDNWETEVMSRQQLPENRHKLVTLKIIRNESTIKLNIIDEGIGFDHKKFINLDPARLFDPNGRGILITMNSGFSSVTYKGKGNEVECIIDLNAVS